MASASTLQMAGMTFVAVAVCGIGGCSQKATFGDGSCDEVAAQLADLPILSSPPAGAKLVDRDYACESDGFPYAAMVFQENADRSAVLAHYRQQLEADGWLHGESAAPLPGSTGDITGYHRRIGGLDVQLNVQFHHPGDTTPDTTTDDPPGRYTIEAFVPDFHERPSGG